MKLITRAAAREKGLTRYFTGIPCARNHTCERLISDEKCVECRREDRNTWFKANPTKKSQYGRQWIRKRRLDILTKVGLRCACCGEDNIEFLTLDHKNGGGNAHRRTFGQSKGTPLKFYKWAAETPSKELKTILQTLCWNCNCAIGTWGYCPHKKHKPRK